MTVIPKISMESWKYFESKYNIKDASEIKSAIEKYNKKGEEFASLTRKESKALGKARASIRAMEKVFGLHENEVMKEAVKTGNNRIMRDFNSIAHMFDQFVKYPSSSGGKRVRKEWQDFKSNNRMFSILHLKKLEFGPTIEAYGKTIEAIFKNADFYMQKVEPVERARVENSVLKFSNSLRDNRVVSEKLKEWWAREEHGLKMKNLDPEDWKVIEEWAEDI